jgi:hypothetical protein
VRVEGGDLQEKGHFPYVFETLGCRPGKFTNHRSKSIMSAPPTMPKAGPA